MDVPDDWTTRLADAIAASLREYAPPTSGERGRLTHGGLPPVAWPWGRSVFLYAGTQSQPAWRAVRSSSLTRAKRRALKRST
jgi:hypothetical protein